METDNMIGIQEKEAIKTADLLNQLLASYQVYYQNLRGFHWNIQGEHFFDLHEKFEELYLESAENIDELAERILTLEAVPFHSFQDYIEHSSIKPHKNVHSANAAVRAIADNLQALLNIERAILKRAAEAEDEGTVTLISDLIKAQEKKIWMFKAYLK